MSLELRRYHEKTLRRRQVHKGKAVDFWVDTVRLPSGGTSVREYLGHPGAVAVVPVLNFSADPRLLFVRQYRHPVRELTYELPAGKLDPGESVRVCVRRELEEETGYRARRLQNLLSYWPTPAFANEIIHIFIARDLFPGKFNPDEDEIIRPQVLTLRQALAKIKRGAIKDSKTIIGLLAFERWALHGR
jgi:ADP-ribose pyrophosphatase